MARLNKLFGLSQRLRSYGINILLIQIDEAHSSAWPVGLVGPDSCVDPQHSYQNRIDRANLFVTKYIPPNTVTVMVDGWDNGFANTFRAWPDKGYIVDVQGVVLYRSEYGTQGDKDAKIVQEYTHFLEQFMDKL